MLRLSRLTLAGLLLSCCGVAAAQSDTTLIASTPSATTPQWWGNLNLGSHHFGGEEDFLGEGESFNEFNPGIGAEVQWQPRHAVAAGYFRNSVDEDSLYVLYHYTPLQWRAVRLGAMVGVVTGYPGYNDGGIAPGGGLIAKIEGKRLGVNLIYLPEISDVTPNTLGLQVKLRFGP